MSEINAVWKKIDELEERLNEVERMTPGHEKKFYRAEICEADPCEHCGGCEEWSRDH
jgi:hypothetical protein